MVVAMACLDVGFCAKAHSIVRSVNKAHYLFLCYCKDVELSLFLSLSGVAIPTSLLSEVEIFEGQQNQQ